MIIVINGPLGIGKSETAWALLYGFERAVMLDGDYIAALHPFDYYQQADLDYAYDLFRLLIQHHLAHGVTTVVLNWVFESAEQLERLRARIDGFGLPVLMYRLTCKPETLAQRIQQRGRADQAWELQRAAELSAILAEAARRGFLGSVIDTTELSIQQVADRIQAHAEASRSA